MRFAQRAAEDLDRVRVAECDARSGVSALAACNGHGQRDGLRSCIVARRLDSHPRVRASGTADRQPTILLAVEVDQDRARDERGVERVRALEPDFLGHRHQQLERAVRQRLVLAERHHRRDRDAVVGAQRRPIRGQPLAVADELDAALRRVVRARRIALADDVQVPLEHEGRRVLASRGRRDADHEVPAGVLHELETVPVRPLANVLDRGLLEA